MTSTNIATVAASFNASMAAFVVARKENPYPITLVDGTETASSFAINITVGSEAQNNRVSKTIPFLREELLAANIAYAVVQPLHAPKSEVGQGYSPVWFGRSPEKYEDLLAYALKERGMSQAEAEEFARKNQGGGMAGVTLVFAEPFMDTLSHLHISLPRLAMLRAGRFIPFEDKRVQLARPGDRITVVTDLTTPVQGQVRSVSFQGLNSVPQGRVESSLNWHWQDLAARFGMMVSDVRTIGAGTSRVPHTFVPAETLAKRTFGEDLEVRFHAIPEVPVRVLGNVSEKMVENIAL